MADRLLLPPQIIGADGRPVSGAKLNTYATGTSTAKAVYSDAALTIAHTNPVVADANGRFPAMFMEASDYRVVLTDASDAVIATYDPISSVSASASSTAAGSLRNRLVNPAMQISQQHGTSNVDTTDSSKYTLDQWLSALSSTPGGTLRVAQDVATTTPGGGRFRLRATAQVADASLAAGDYYLIGQLIEGEMVADARFGSASARQLILRLGVRSSVAGAFGVSVANSDSSRSWVGLITIAAGEINTDVVRTVLVPGDVAGTWLRTTGIGMKVFICLGAGTDLQGAEGWNASGYVTTSSQTNLMATGGATFDLFDTGLYIDAAASGEAPTWELPCYADELARCQRYWQAHSAGASGATSTSTVADFGVSFPVPMRVAPTLAQIGSDADLRIGGSTANIAGTFTLLVATTTGAAFYFTRGSSTWTAPVSALLVNAIPCVAFSARL